jgi:hypothetical protein
VDILDHHQHRIRDRQCDQLFDEGGKRPLFAVLRRQSVPVERPAGLLMDRRSASSAIVPSASARRRRPRGITRLSFVELLVGAVVQFEPGRPPQLAITG